MESKNGKYFLSCVLNINDTSVGEDFHSENFSLLVFVVERLIMENSEGKNLSSAVDSEENSPTQALREQPKQ